MANPFKLFFVPIIQLFSKICPQLPRPSTSAKAVDSEVVAPLLAGGNAVDQTEASGNGAKKQAQEAGLALVHHMEWAEIVIAFCLVSRTASTFHVCRSRNTFQYSKRVSTTFFVDGPHMPLHQARAPPHLQLRFKPSAPRFWTLPTTPPPYSISVSHSAIAKFPKSQPKLPCLRQ